MIFSFSLYLPVKSIMLTKIKYDISSIKVNYFLYIHKGLSHMKCMAFLLWKVVTPYVGGYLSKFGVI